MTLPKDRGGVVLQIELGAHRPDRREVMARISDLATRLMPNTVLVGYRFGEDAVEVAFVSAERFRAAEREGPAAVQALAPWPSPGEGYGLAG